MENVNTQISAETRDKMHKLLDMVIDRNASGNATWFKFLGHVMMIQIDICDGEWKPFCECEYMDMFLDEEFSKFLGYPTWEEMEDRLCVK